MIGLLNFENFNYEKQDLTGKVAIVTGANVGIGLETVRQLASLNCKVYLLCRNEHKALKAIEDVISTTNNTQLHFIKFELTSLESVKEAVNTFNKLENKLDILINNAGLIKGNFEVTEDNIEFTLQCNYFSPLLLMHLLLHKLKAAGNSRVVNVASAVGIYDLENLSGLDESKFSMMPRYGTSKLYFIMTGKLLARKLKEYNILVVSTHPGFVATDFGNKPDFKENWWYIFINILLSISEVLFARKPEKGAATTLHAAIDPSISLVNSGDYYESCKIVDLSITAFKDQEKMQKLYSKTCELLQIEPLL